MTACVTPQSTETPGLEGTLWQLKSVSGRTLTIPEKPSIELRFLDSRVNFHACNAQSGRYTQEGNEIRVAKGFVGTRMACEEHLMAIDTAAALLFEKGVQFSVQDNTLTLEGSGERWRFERRSGETLRRTDRDQAG